MMAMDRLENTNMYISTRSGKQNEGNCIASETSIPWGFSSNLFFFTSFIPCSRLTKTKTTTATQSQQQHTKKKPTHRTFDKLNPNPTSYRKL